MVVVDSIDSGSAESARQCAAYALHLALRNPVGRPPGEGTVRHWMRSAGLKPAEHFDLLGNGALTAIIGHRR